MRNTAQIDLPAIRHHAARRRAPIVFCFTQANAGAERQRAVAIAKGKQHAAADMGLIVCLHHRPAAGDHRLPFKFNIGIVGQRFGIERNGVLRYAVSEGTTA